MADENRIMLTLKTSHVDGQGKLYPACDKSHALTHFNQKAYFTPADLPWLVKCGFDWEFTGSGNRTAQKVLELRNISHKVAQNKVTNAA